MVRIKQNILINPVMTVTSKFYVANCVIEDLNYFKFIEECIYILFKTVYNRIFMSFYDQYKSVNKIYVIMICLLNRFRKSYNDR